MPTMETNNLVLEQPQQPFGRVVSTWIWNLYIQMRFFLQYWFTRFTRPFTNHISPDVARSTRKTIINSLIANFSNEEIKLIDPNEPVEETFYKKLAEKDYDSAMKLAKKFDFDMDLIYKSMWENNKISISLIDDCLTKVSKTLWTLKECVHCIPDQLEVAQHLLRLGLEISSQPSLAPCPLESNANYEKTELSEEACQFIHYRQFLVLYHKRLCLYECILQCRHGLNYRPHFDRQFYSELRSKSIFELAINFANQAEHHSLSMLFEQEQNILGKHYLVILSNLPETISPAKYEDLLIKLFSLLDVPQVEVTDEATQLTDWSSKFATTQCANDKFEESFYRKHPHYVSYLLDSDLNHTKLTEWFNHRAREILQCTLLVDNALELLQYGIERCLPLEQLFTEMDLYSLQLYENNDHFVPFDQFEQLSLVEKMNLIMYKHDAIYAIEHLFDCFIEKLAKYNLHSSVKFNKKELLKEFMVNLAKKNFSQCLAIFKVYSMADKSLEQIRSMRIINDCCDLIELALDCLYAYESSDSLDMAYQLLECLPDRSQADILLSEEQPAKIRHFHRLNDQADQVEHFLSVIAVFSDYNTHLIVSQLDAITRDKCPEKAKLFFEKAIVNFCNTSFNNVDLTLEWKNFLWNLQDFRKTFFNVITAQQLVEMCVRNLLLSGQKKFIQLALNYISFRVDRTTSKKVPYEQGKELLKLVATDYIKFANPAQDENIELARMCLQPLHDHHQVDEEIEEELDLIEAINILYHEFEFVMLPIKIKQCAQPRITLLETILRSSKKVYTNVDKLLSLSQLLRICKQYSEQHREGIVLSIIGKEAIHQEDYATTEQVCKLVLERNLSHGWDLCYLLAKCCNAQNEHIITTNQQLALLSFALAYCPESDVEAHFDILNQIKCLKSSSMNNKKMPSPSAFIAFKGGLSVR